MTSYELKKRFRAGSSVIRKELTESLNPGPLPPERGLAIGVNHPMDGVGICVQSEMDGEEQRATERRFHCFHLTEAEFLELAKACKRALRVSKSLTKQYLSETD